MALVFERQHSWTAILLSFLLAGCAAAASLPTVSQASARTSRATGRSVRIDHDHEAEIAAAVAHAGPDDAGLTLCAEPARCDDTNKPDLVRGPRIEPVLSAEPPAGHVVVPTGRGPPRSL